MNESRIEKKRNRTFETSLHVTLTTSFVYRCIVLWWIANMPLHIQSHPNVCICHKYDMYCRKDLNINTSKDKILEHLQFQTEITCDTVSAAAWMFQPSTESLWGRQTNKRANVPGVTSVPMSVSNCNLGSKNSGHINKKNNNNNKKENNVNQ